MKKSDMIQILTEAKLLYGSHDLTEPEVLAWFNWFGNHEPKEFRSAMMAGAKNSKFFPTPGIVQAEIEAQKPKNPLTITGQEALELTTSNPLAIAASKFADRVTPDISKAQFESPEDLDKANRINEAQWRRNFIDRFEILQDRAKSLNRSGLTLEAAVVQALEAPSNAAKALLERANIKTLEAA